MLFDKIVHNLQQLCSEAGSVQHLGAGDNLDDVLPGHRLHLHLPLPLGSLLVLLGLAPAPQLGVAHLGPRPGRVGGLLLALAHRVVSGAHPLVGLQGAGQEGPGTGEVSMSIPCHYTQSAASPGTVITGHQGRVIPLLQHLEI